MQKRERCRNRTRNWIGHETHTNSWLYDKRIDHLRQLTGVLNGEQIRQSSGSGAGEQGRRASTRRILPKVKSARALAKISDDRYLAVMSKCVFRAGFVWHVVENKWPGFEQVFASFNPDWIAMQPYEKLEEIARDERIIRNYTKVKSVYANAIFIRDIRAEHGSFGKFLADWPEQDIVGLWTYLKKHASRLGGASGPYFLRFVGKDTFLLTDHVVAALIQYGFTTQNKFTSQKALREMQGVFNDLRAETNRSFAEISRILACSI